MADADDAQLSPAQAAATETDFGAFVARWQGHVHRVAGRLMNWRSDVEDVVQDVFLAVLEHPKGLSKVRDSERWLTTVTLNACRARLRREALWRTCFGWLRRPVESAFESPPADEDEQQAVRRAIADLPILYREVVVLRYLEGLEALDIAGILAVSADVVATRLSRARALLRDALPKSGE